MRVVFQKVINGDGGEAHGGVSGKEENLTERVREGDEGEVLGERK